MTLKRLKRKLKSYEDLWRVNMLSRLIIIIIFICVLTIESVAQEVTCSAQDVKLWLSMKVSNEVILASCGIYEYKQPIHIKPKRSKKVLRCD